MYIKQWYKYRHKSGVYQIINNITNKSYIGSSNNIATRLSHHVGKQCRGIKKDSLWYDMIKYGKENFTINILKYCDIKDLIYYEKYYNCKAKNIVSKIRECILHYRKSYYHCFFESVETIPKGSTFTIDT